MPISATLLRSSTRRLPTCVRVGAALVNHAYVISMGGERLELMALQLDASCIPWQRWAAIVPNESTYDALGHLLPLPLRTNRSAYKVQLRSSPRSAALLGNYLSHLSLWEDLLRNSASAPSQVAWLVLEDDLWLAPQWQQLLKDALPAVPATWKALQLTWFGSRVPFAAVNSIVDRVERHTSTSLALSRSVSRTHGDELHDGKTLTTRGGRAEAAYLGLQMMMLRAEGIRCLIERLPRLHVPENTCVDSMSVRAGCPERYALHDGDSRQPNWDNSMLLAWHTTRRVRTLQLWVYANPGRLASEFFVELQRNTTEHPTGLIDMISGH
mmetsp:Transcript_44825/g.74395  ORF Transcript_44825/g.74395 Transcript_44825/m.74395 type:complete len:326 (+) Transcript_44825:351-1328(+)